MVVAGVLAGCATWAPGPSLVPLGDGIAVAADELRPVDRCMLEAGFRVTIVHPGRSGSNGVYSWETTTWYTWEPGGPTATVAAAADCQDRFAPAREETVDELREIYHRWILERECLIGLGYSPDAPPAFEEFRAEWRTGPWMPIDGVEFRALGAEAKERCGLEMLD